MLAGSGWCVGRGLVGGELLIGRPLLLEKLEEA